MPALNLSTIGRLLEPFAPDASEELLKHLSDYLDLLLKWNAKTNLTAVREPEEIVTRHFGESLFAGRRLSDVSTLLDYGTGAGFPGLPIALLRPEIAVTLAESQNKKVSFLREAARTLGVRATVWPKRVEEMAASESFECVTLRAVDDMASAVEGARVRASREILMLTSTGALAGLKISGFELQATTPIPVSTDRVIGRFVLVG